MQMQTSTASTIDCVTRQSSIELLPMFSGSKQRQREIKHNKAGEEIEILKYVPIKEKTLSDEDLLKLRAYVTNYEMVINEDEIKEKIKSFVDSEELDIDGLKKYLFTISDGNITKELQTKIYQEFKLSLTTKQVKALLEI